MVKLVLQRVKRGSVKVDDKIVGKIDKGIVVLIGIHRDDTIKDIEWAVNRLLKYSLWEDEEGRGWKKCITDIDGELLLVSQFTLYARPNGKKPDFSHSMKPDEAQNLYNKFVELVKNSYKPEKVQTGQFQALMEVELVNDGPVTMIFESAKDTGGESKK